MLNDGFINNGLRMSIFLPPNSLETKSLQQDKESPIKATAKLVKLDPNHPLSFDAGAKGYYLKVKDIQYFTFKEKLGPISTLYLLNSGTKTQQRID